MALFVGTGLSKAACPNVCRPIPEETSPLRAKQIFAKFSPSLGGGDRIPPTLKLYRAMPLFESLLPFRSLLRRATNLVERLFGEGKQRATAFRGAEGEGGTAFSPSVSLRQS